MKNKIKKILSNGRVYFYLRDVIVFFRQRKQYSDWVKAGKPASPPHLLKQKILKRYAKKYNLTTFVETGTYYGDMINVMKKTFSKLYSIELSSQLFELASKRFQYNKKIKLVCGDSGEMILSVINKIDAPTLFWLDGHYSAGGTAKGEFDTPILKELLSIFDNMKHEYVILIDDARCFGSIDGYPTMKSLEELVQSVAKDKMIINVEDDIIRICKES